MLRSLWAWTAIAILVVVAMFGVLKSGAIAVPLFTLFGPDGVRLRVKDCAPAMLVTNHEKAATAREIEGLRVEVFDEALFQALVRLPSEYRIDTRYVAPDGATGHHTIRVEVT